MRAVTEKDFRVWMQSLGLDKNLSQKDELWLMSFTPDESLFSDPQYWAAFCATGY